MSRTLNVACLMGLLVAMATGCGGNGLGLVDASGTVTYKGSPVAGASVTFVPSDGPTATGRTDADGEFELFTGDLPGVVVGNAQISITAYPPPDPDAGKEFREISKDPEKLAETMREMMSLSVRAGVDDGGAATRSKSRIPIKYSVFSSSGLTATVTDDPDNNQFSFDLE